MKKHIVTNLSIPSCHSCFKVFFFLSLPEQELKENLFGLSAIESFQKAVIIVSNPSSADRSFLSFAKKNMIPIGLLLASIIAVIFFSKGFIANLIYFADPRHQNQPLEYWMTPRYVVMSYDLPPPIVDEVMGLRPKIDKRKPLTRVLEDLDITLEELQTRINEAQAAHLESLEKKRPPKKEKPEKPEKPAKAENTQ